MNAQEQRDALLARHIRHTDWCVTDDGITDCSCLMVERGERMRDALDALIAAVRAEEADRLRALEAGSALAARSAGSGSRVEVTAEDMHGHPDECSCPACDEPITPDTDRLRALEADAERLYRYITDTESAWSVADAQDMAAGLLGSIRALLAGEADP